jgi:transcription elongation factor GreA
LRRCPPAIPGNRVASASNVQIPEPGTPVIGAADLLRGVGLLADGPLMWRRPVPSARPGVFIVELPAPVPSAPIDAATCGKWIERVPTLLLDGERPNGVQLQRRLASFWLPSTTVLYVGSTLRSMNGRIGAMYATELGDRKPHSGGHWLKTLRGLDQLRIWWAETDAAAEAELELAIAFAGAVEPSEAEHLPDPAVVLPFANLEDPVGVRRQHGLTGYLLAAEVEPAPRPTSPAQSPGTEQPARRSAARAPARRATAAPSARAASDDSPRRGARSTGGRLRQSIPPKPPAAEVVHLTADGVERLNGELAALLARRPGVIDRIRSARELGDLRENSEYQEARREQSFLEGRIQAIEATLRAAVVDASSAGESPIDTIRRGTTVTLESSDGIARYTLVGPREAEASSGRLSTSSPIGLALLGRRLGDDVVVTTPAGERLFRILEMEES